MKCFKSLAIILLFQGFTLQGVAQDKFTELRLRSESLSTMLPDSASVLAHQLLNMAKASANKQQLADAHSTMTLAKIWQNRPDEADSLNKLAWQMNKETGNLKEQCNNLNYFGKIRQNRQQQQEALRYFLDALEISEKNGFHSLTQYSYRSMSNLSIAQQKNEKGLEYAQKALQEGRLQHSAPDIADDFVSLAVAYEKNEQPDSAAKYYSQAFDMYKKAANVFRQGYVLSEWSILYEESDPVRSFEMAVDAQQYFDSVAPQNILSVTNIGNIGAGFSDMAEMDSLPLLKRFPQTRTKTGFLNQAVLYLKRAVELSHQNNLPIQLSYFGEYLSDVEAGLGNYQQAFENLQMAKQKSDSMFSQKQKNALAKLESEKELFALQQANDKKTAANRLMSVAGIALLLVSLLGFRNFRNRQKIQRQKIAELENEKKLAAVDALIQGQEEERKRLATDLHDGLGGMLSGVKLTFNNMKENLVLTPENVERFEKSLEQLDNSIGELRKISHNLMPDVLVKFGLSEALKDFCASLSGNPRPVIIFQYHGAERSFNNTSKLFIYRIVQELVYNAVKHAGAGEILAQVTVSPSQVLIAVDDDGKGFETGELIGNKGVGMKSVKQRVEYLNGKLQIDSSPGKGTSVNIELSL